MLLALPPALAIEQVDFTPRLSARLRELAAGTAVWMVQVVKAIAVFGPRARRPREVHLVDWSRETFTQPTVEPDGTSAGFGAPEYQEAIAGRIHWASTETATAYAGHVEGAVLAGLAAAERIDAALAD